jgi:soluble lytic murein transglycosylase
VPDGTGENKKEMKHRLLPALALLLGLTCAPTGLHAQQGDQRILAAREALRTGDRVTLERLAAKPEKHLLESYVQHWLLINKLARTDPPPVAELQSFLARHPGTATGERLQAAWLRRLAKDEDWNGFLALFASHRNPDAELRCLQWQARLLTGDTTAVDELMSGWAGLADANEGCLPVLRMAALQRSVDEEALWQHFRLQIDSRSPDRAQMTLAWIDGKDAAQDSTLTQAIRSPATFVDRLAPNFAVNRRGRELAIAALVRLARSDPLAAYARFTRLSDRLSHEDRRYLHAVFGHHAALSRLPQATDWYRAAGDAPMTEAQRAWRVRAALRSADWPQVEQAILALPESERRQPEWIYWLGRALAARGHGGDAEALYRKLADDADFYGLLAAEELGRLFAPPSPDAPVNPGDAARVRGDEAIRRAFALYRLDLRSEATREWFSAVRDRDPGFLIAAAHAAYAEGLYDRAINTAEMADPRNHWGVRFITPHRPLIEPQAKQEGLDLAWVYGLMRQESRFVVPARSSAGAQGLMQVMPATGKWVAQQIGMKNYHPRLLTDPKVNVKLGTSYMRLILDGLDHHPVLASAGYNAGPGRARRWRDAHPIDAAIYIETIPFDETRNYVKKVLANAVVYAAQFERRPQSLKARLGIIGPGDGN